MSDLKILANTSFHRSLHRLENNTNRHMSFHCRPQITQRHHLSTNLWKTHFLQAPHMKSAAVYSGLQRSIALYFVYLCVCTQFTACSVEDALLKTPHRKSVTASANQECTFLAIVIHVQLNRNVSEDLYQSPVLIFTYWNKHMSSKQHLGFIF